MLGFTKKGKQFYSFDTHLAEKISSLHVIDNSIWLTGEYTFTQLVDHAEAQFYIAPDRINDSDVSLSTPLAHVLLLKLSNYRLCNCVSLAKLTGDAGYS